MPPTEECVLGAENKTRIINIEKAVDKIATSVEKLTNCYSQRPTKAVLVAITILAGLLGTSIGVNATLIAVIMRISSG
jgi:tetrahydromethanopterin S-methyltransferase subunit G